MSHTRKSMKRKKGLKPLWIYDGSPDLADLTVAATTLADSAGIPTDAIAHAANSGRRGAVKIAFDMRGKH